MLDVCPKKLPILQSIICLTFADSEARSSLILKRCSPQSSSCLPRSPTRECIANAAATMCLFRLKHCFLSRQRPSFQRTTIRSPTTSFGQLQELELDCPHCSQKIKLTLPTRHWKQSLTLYGDEAIREDILRPFFCLSLVGGSRQYVDNGCAALRDLKQQLEPTRSADHWRFHMTDLHSGQKRKRHPIFANWNREKVAYAVHSLFHLIESANKELFVFVLIYLGNTPAPILQVKTKAYMALLSDVIYTFTQTGVSPRFVLDAEKNVHGETTVIQNWARRAFLGMRTTAPVRLFLSRRSCAGAAICQTRLASMPGIS